MVNSTRAYSPYARLVPVIVELRALLFGRSTESCSYAEPLASFFDTMIRFPVSHFGGPLPGAGLLLPVDRFQSPYHEVDLVTLFPKVRKNLLNTSLDKHTTKFNYARGSAIRGTIFRAVA